MENLESLIFDIIQLPEKKRTREYVLRMKRQWAKKEKVNNVPTNIALFKTYQSLIAQGKIEQNNDIENLLRKRSVRSGS